MFRRQEATIEPDASYPADLKALGFFVNSLGHIRMIEAPEKQYVFHSTNNERHNEVRREAMYTCARQEMEKRLAALSINHIYLPGFTTTKPLSPHVPVLAPSPEVLKSRKRIIVVVNDAIQDLGILAYRQLQRELGINGGTAVNFVKEIVKRSNTGDAAHKYNNIFDDGHGVKDDDDTPTLVVLNTGQLLYSHKYNQAMTLRSWSAMPRKSIAHDMVRVHQEENSIPGHRDAKEHIRSVFDSVLYNKDRVSPEAEIYVIAIEGGTDNLLKILDEDFDHYGSRITAMALIHSLIDDSQVKNPTLRAFLHQRAREWRYSDLTNDPDKCTEVPEGYYKEAKGTSAEQFPAPERIEEHIAWNENVQNPGALSGIVKAMHRLIVSATPSQKEVPSSASSDTDTLWSSGQGAICPTFAGGPESAGECIFTNSAVQQTVLKFFEEVAQDPENYRNPNMSTYTEAPLPTPDAPLALDPENPDIAGFSSLAAEMTPEQMEVDEAKEKLQDMRLALSACPSNVPELASGRAKLVHRIAIQETKIEKLQKKALATGGLAAGEAPEQRENWKPQKEGPKVAFAGTMVDSELLKAAGLGDTAEEELAKLV
ncbi:Arb2 domain-containing protein [Paraphoma chrysanthemicola]|uniref:Arb2 domain-containing protein n=1 Tax=Paraphoma chrysanthemicola TaxID=798071 RepID=A0A8K0VQX7_9PLEO|nr:Arb2 domain-containing protein [Paraphoma chrysanthemicola]